MFHNLAHIPTCIYQKYQVDTPLSHKLCKIVLSVFSPIFSGLYSFLYLEYGAAFLHKANKSVLQYNVSIVLLLLLGSND